MQWGTCGVFGVFEDLVNLAEANVRQLEIKTVKASQIDFKIGGVKMKTLTLTTLILVIALGANADDLGNHAPPKPIGGHCVLPAPNPALLRQGGDTIEDAIPITLHTVDLAGTTTGYSDDYDIACPYIGSPAPDVVYSLILESDHILDIDMFGSQYDTKIWVWDESLDWPIACNDDYYPDYTSRIQNMAVAAGTQYFIVVDGYYEHGEYLIDVVPSDDCEVSSPAGTVLEGEPPLIADYVDLHNGGCNTNDVDPPLQEISAATFGGKSGWYLNGGYTYRDTDWFTTRIPSGGVLEVTLEAEVGTRLLEIGPHECGTVDILQEVISEDCDTPTLTVVGEEGAAVWLWVGPAGYYPSGMPFDAYEYNYLLTTNLGVVSVEEQSWAGVKAMFR